MTQTRKYSEDRDHNGRGLSSRQKLTVCGQVLWNRGLEESEGKGWS